MEVYPSPFIITDKGRKHLVFKDIISYDRLMIACFDLTYLTHITKGNYPLIGIDGGKDFQIFCQVIQMQKFPAVFTFWNKHFQIQMAHSRM